jgi:sodium-dependent dicarboxylate transporter 2/3/5
MHSWEMVHEKMPWGIILLLGGGFALAEGSQRSCLSFWIGSQLEALGDLPNW